MESTGSPACAGTGEVSSQIDIRPTEFTLVPSFAGEHEDLVQVQRAFGDDQHRAGRVMLYVSDTEDGARRYRGAHLTIAELEALLDRARKILAGGGR